MKTMPSTLPTCLAKLRFNIMTLPGRKHFSSRGTEFSRACRIRAFARILCFNKTRQGYARERILKPAGYFFAGRALWPQ
jgi:hypothetical protein